MEKDMISELPNEILANIVSRLPIKEAAGTSVLSHKWQNIWTRFFGILDLDHSLKMFNLSEEFVGPLKKSKLFVSEWQSFMGWVEQVLKSLTSSTLQGLRICIDLGNPSKIAHLLKFALEKNVETLDLDFTYTYTDTFLEISELNRNVVLPYMLVPPSSSNSLALRVLRLASVDVTGQILEHFLSCCPSLETLYVRDSKCLNRLKVSGPLLRLKHLHLLGCSFLILEISAENLMTFSYSGYKGKFSFKSMPNLVEASFGGRYARCIEMNMRHANIFKLLSQVNVLKLELCLGEWKMHQDLPQVSNVKHLELYIPHKGGMDFNRHVSFLSAFPSIRVLKVKFKSADYKREDRPLKELEAEVKHEYQNLKELQVCGYRRHPCQIEFITHILKNAANLKRMAIDPVSQNYMESSAEVKTKLREIRRDCTNWFAHGLKPYLPPSVEMLVL